LSVLALVAPSAWAKSKGKTPPSSSNSGSDSNSSGSSGSSTPVTDDGEEARAKREASKLLDDGLANYQKGEFATAAHEFEAAYQVFKSAKILFNLGKSYQALGRVAEAANAFDQFLDETGHDASLEKHHRQAREALDVLKPQLGLVVVKVSPVGAALELDGVLMPRLHAFALPGSHRIQGSCTGCTTRALQVDVKANQSSEVALDLSSQTPPVVEAQNPNANANSNPNLNPGVNVNANANVNANTASGVSNGDVPRAVSNGGEVTTPVEGPGVISRLGVRGWVGVGLLGVAAGSAYFGGYCAVSYSVASNNASRASPAAQGSYRLTAWRNASIADFTLAVASATAGAVLVFTALNDSGTTSAAVAPMVTPNGAGVTLAGHFDEGRWGR
jgi:hypothetical protein